MFGEGPGVSRWRRVWRIIRERMVFSGNSKLEGCLKHRHEPGCRFTAMGSLRVRWELLVGVGRSGTWCYLHYGKGAPAALCRMG